MGKKKTKRHQATNQQATPIAMSGSSHPPHSQPAGFPSHTKTFDNNAPNMALDSPPSETTWSKITPSAENIEKLRLLCHSQKELKKKGYVRKPLDQNQIEAKLRCIKCGKRGSRKPPKSIIAAAEKTKKPKTIINDDRVCDEKVGGCGKPGHLADRCWESHPELIPARVRARTTQPAINTKTDAVKNKMMCRKCGEGGHLFTQCEKSHLGPKPTAKKGTRKDQVSKTLEEKTPKTSTVVTEKNSTTTTAKIKKRSNACKYHVGHVRDKVRSCRVTDRLSFGPSRLANKHGNSTSRAANAMSQNPVEETPLSISEMDEYNISVFNHLKLAAIRAKGPFFTRTPRNTAGTSSSFGSLPDRTHNVGPTHDHREAIALDCEMGISKTSESELIRLTAVDFFTGAILIDNLVYPSVLMLHYKTRYSGVSRSAMDAAVRDGTAIQGRDRARMALLRFVGLDTVIVVHGGRNDFECLRWIHPLLIDTFILEGYFGHDIAKKVETEKVAGENIEAAAAGGGRSLKDLCKRKLGIDVQIKGKQGHDSYEDAMGARELVVGWMSTIPDA